MSAVTIGCACLLLAVAMVFLSVGLITGREKTALGRRRCGGSHHKPDNSEK